MTKWHGGKGSAPRKNADRKAYADNWDKIFGKKNEDKEKNQKDLEKDQQNNETGSIGQDNQSGNQS